MSDGGKGSAPRPLGIDWDKFEENWDAIFGGSNNVANKPGAGSGDLLRGVVLGEDQRDRGGSQHGQEGGTKDKPSQ